MREKVRLRNIGIATYTLIKKEEKHETCFSSVILKELAFFFAPFEEHSPTEEHALRFVEISAL